MFIAIILLLIMLAMATHLTFMTTYITADVFKYDGPFIILAWFGGWFGYMFALLYGFNEIFLNATVGNDRPGKVLVIYSISYLVIFHVFNCRVSSGEKCERESRYSRYIKQLQYNGGSAPPLPSPHFPHCPANQMLFDEQIAVYIKWAKKHNPSEYQRIVSRMQSNGRITFTNLIDRLSPEFKKFIAL